MFLSATKQKNFIPVIADFFTDFSRKNTFEARVSKFKKIFLLDIENFYKKKTLEKTFKGRRFKVDEISFYNYNIDIVTGFETYKIMKAISMEKIFRTFFKNNEVREIIHQIVKGDEILKKAINFLIHFPEEEWEFNSKKERVKIKTFDINYNKNILYINEPISLQYLKSSYLFLVLLSVISDKEYDKIPIGRYEIHSSEEEWEGLYKDDFIPFYMEILLDSFNEWENQDIYEKIYNSSLGVMHRLKLEDLSEIDTIISMNTGNIKSLKKIFCLMISSSYSENITNKIIQIILDLVEIIGSSIGKEIIYVSNKYEKLYFYYRTIYFLLPNLTEEELFILVENKNSKSVDEFGISRGYIGKYILQEQIKRYSGRNELDCSIKSLLNKVKFEDKQRLLKMIFFNPKENVC